MGFGIPRRTQKKQTYETVRPIVRRAVYQRDGGRCRCGCGQALALHGGGADPVGHAHELRSRSIGGDPLCAADIILLAPACHARATGQIGTGKTLDFVTEDPAIGAAGGIWVFERCGAIVQSCLTFPVVSRTEFIS